MLYTVIVKRGNKTSKTDSKKIKKTLDKLKTLWYNKTMIKRSKTLKKQKGFDSMAKYYMGKWHYTLTEILEAVADGNQLDKDEREFVRQKLECDRARAEQRAILRKQRKESFQEEIIAVLKMAPNSGFTPTDVQFLLDNFVERRITNQKVAAHLKDLACKGKISKANVNNDMIMYFCGALDCGYTLPIKKINTIYSAKGV